MDTLITTGLRDKLVEIQQREDEQFGARIPRSLAWLEQAKDVMPNGVPMSWMVEFWKHSPVVVASGSGSSFTDIDGNSYRDFNLCDLAMAAGFAPSAIVNAVSAQAARGNHFLLPTEDALIVSRLLGDRFGLPYWQYTLSASGANTEAMRLARAFTDREQIVTFEWKYHGHMDEMMWGQEGPLGIGISAGSGGAMREVPFNDLTALESALASKTVAAILLEPVMTNCGLVMPTPGYHAALREAASRHGTLVIADVTHTQFAVLGGGAQEYGLDPDIVTGGKGIGGGVPIGVYGMRAELGEFLAEHLEGDPSGAPGVPTGGTLYANALSMAAAHAGLTEIFTPQNHATVDALAQQLQTGLQALVDKTGLGFSIDRWGGRCQWRLTNDVPTDGREGALSANEEFSQARMTYFANRGIWEAIPTSGPAVSFAAAQDDVDAYLDVSEQFLAELA
jgi:glutamate-1-semialdehyde 2,1-aminomutase